jgi:hypothetical protein
MRSTHASVVAEKHIAATSRLIYVRIACIMGTLASEIAELAF